MSNRPGVIGNRPDDAESAQAVGGRGAVRERRSSHTPRRAVSSRKTRTKSRIERTPTGVITVNYG